MKKLFNTKFKKFLWLAILIIAILSASLLRIVPNYANKYGFEIVHLWDYNKYNQGYCLAENRILDKEELYKRAIIQFLDKNLIWERKLDEARVYVYGSSYKSKVEIGYYELDDEINLDNWLEKIVNDYKDLYIPIKDIKAKAELDEKAGKELLFDKLKIKKTNPLQYLKIDMDKMVAGFNKPIFIANGAWGGDIALKNAFVLRNKRIEYGYRFNLFYTFYDSWANTMPLDKKKFNNELSKSKYSYPRSRIGKIDNCGNLDYDVNSNVKDIADSLGKGG